MKKYEEILALQGGVCAICGSPPGEKRLAVDHNHRCCPGRGSCGNCVRGLLCGGCNLMLGLIEKRGDILSIVEKYLNICST